MIPEVGILIVNGGPVGDMIFGFQGVGGVHERVTRRHHRAKPDDLDVEQAYQVDVLDLVGDGLKGEVGHLGAKWDGKEKNAVVSVRARVREIWTHLGRAESLGGMGLHGDKDLDKVLVICYRLLAPRFFPPAKKETWVVVCDPPGMST